MEENRVRKLMFKVILIGEIAVGKTSVMRRFVHRKFEGNTKGTIGADFMVKEISLDNKFVTLQIWDTAGGERFQSLGRAFYRGADCCVLVYDTTRPQTLEKIGDFRSEFQKQTECSETKFPFALVRNKTDLFDADHGHVTSQKSQDFFDKNFSSHSRHFSTSAKEGDGIEELFEWIAKSVSKSIDEDEEEESNYEPDDRVELTHVVPESENQVKSSRCCKTS
jgi:Ras-related protein Rab-7A